MTSYFFCFVITLSFSLFNSEVKAQELSVFYDGSYVDTCDLNTCEAYTFVQFLSSIGISPNTFSGLDSNAVFNGIACSDFFILPETEVGDFAGSIPDDSKALIRDYVNQGGVFIVLGSDGLNRGSSNSAENLNSIFNYSISNDIFTSSGFSYINPASTDPFRNQYPDSLRQFTTTNFITNLPMDSDVIYASSNNKSSVVRIPYGSGFIFYLGWSFFDAGPIGNQGPDRWSIFIQQILNNYQSSEFYPNCTYCDTEKPVYNGSLNLQGYTNADGNYFVNKNSLNFSDNCENFQIEFLGDSVLNCSNGLNQSVELRVVDEAGNALMQSINFQLFDTIHPVFEVFPNDVTVECEASLDPVIMDTLVYSMFVNELIDIDSLSIQDFLLEGWRLPSGAVISEVSININGFFNDFDQLWLRLVDDLAGSSNSSLLYDGVCSGSGRFDNWFSDSAVDIDCTDLGSSKYYRSVNVDLSIFRNLQDTLFLQVLNLGHLEGTLISVDLQFIYTSDLTWPSVEEACAFNIEYQDLDNRGDCPIGAVFRRFTATDGSGNSVTGIQVINVVDSRPVEIDYPEDYVIDCISGRDLSASLHPDSLPQTFAYPTVMDECLDYTISYSDRLVSNCGVHNQVFRRTWRIVSDCRPNKEYLHIQDLRIQDTSAPILPNIPAYQVTVDASTCVAGNNFFYPSISQNDILDCDEQVDLQMRVIDSNGVEFNPVELSVGNYFVEITAADDCGNASMELVPVEFIDLVAPNIFCNQSIPRVELDNAGIATLCARDMVTNPSTADNCGVEVFQINTIQSFNNSLDCIELDCSDLGFQTVFVRALDFSGNQDVCSGQIQVVDEIAPQIKNRDVTIPCSEPFDPDNYQLPLATDNCDPSPRVECFPFSFIGSFCDSVYVRTCLVEDASGNKQTGIQQFLRRVDTSGFVIDWPDEVVDLNCGSSPDPNITGRPQVSADCTPFDIQYQDNQSILCGNPELFSIERQWFVRNLCNQNLFTFNQVINITDLDPPVFTYPSTTTVNYEIPDFDCGMQITLTAEAEDECSDFITYSNSVSGSGNMFTGYFDRGEHPVTFYATDLCGNIDSLEVIVLITENKNPFVSCKQGQDFFLNEIEFVDIYPEDVLDTAFDLCTVDDSLDFYISKVLDNGQDIGRQPFVRYRCGDLGIKKVRLFARDDDLNIGSCDVNIQIIDTFSNCPNGNFFDISGMIFNVARDPIGGGVALLNENKYQGRNHGLNGEYVFRRLQTDSCYMVSVEKDSSALNGITAMDLALIRQHILNLKRITNPYYYIAADVNNNEAISTTDIALLRRLVLELDQEFTFVPSWRFVPEDHKFTNEQNPFDPPVPYAETVCLMNASIPFVNFIGIKMGDVNGSADLNRLNGPQSRNESHKVRVKKTQTPGYWEYSFFMDQHWKSAQLYLEFDGALDQELSLAFFDNPKENIFIRDGFVSVVYDGTESSGSKEFLKLRVPNDYEPIMDLRLRSDRSQLASIDLKIEYPVELEWLHNSYDDCYQLESNAWSNDCTILERCSGDPFDYTVLDQLGRVLSRGNSFQHTATFSGSDWPTGVYFIKISSRSGEEHIFKSVKIHH